MAVAGPNLALGLEVRYQTCSFLNYLKLLHSRSSNKWWWKSIDIYCVTVRTGKMGSSGFSDILTVLPSVEGARKDRCLGVMTPKKEMLIEIFILCEVLKVNFTA